MNRFLLAGLLLVSIVVIGCDPLPDPAPPPLPPPPTTVLPQPAPPPLAPPSDAGIPIPVPPLDGPQLPPGDPLEKLPPGGPELTPPTLPPDQEAVKAEVGVGKKGRSLDQYEGALVTPAKAYFAVREKAIFEIQIPQAMQFFKAETGEGPKSHEEFMEKIVTANQIKLPELPAGQIYRYNVELEELQVVRPKQ